MDAIDRINGLLIKKGMTQVTLAERSGVRKETINRILQRKQVLKPNTLEKIAKALDVSVFYLNETEDDRGDQFKIQGYVEYGPGFISKVTTLKELKDLVVEIERKEKDYNFREAVLPSQKKIKLEDIDLLREESIDATRLLVMSFKSKDDVIDGEKFDIGNMCPGYEFDINGVSFYNSEAAYIAGLFSNNTNTHFGIQDELIKCNNGLAAKKKIRRKYEKEEHQGRLDWTEPDPDTGIPFNVEWMKYVVWQKCKKNESFAQILRKVPVEAMIVENSTGRNDPTAKFWGCHNIELERRRKVAGEKFKAQHPGAKKREVEAEMLKMNNVGTWTGKNVMGKILKACSLCLINGVELPINTRFLFDKKVYLFTERLDFGIKRSFSDFGDLIIDDDFQLP